MYIFNFAQSGRIFKIQNSKEVYSKSYEQPMLVSIYQIEK